MAPQKTDGLFERRVWLNGEYIVAHDFFHGHGIRKPVDGFAAIEMPDDEQLQAELPVYDALYAWCQEQVRAA